MFFGAAVSWQGVRPCPIARRHLAQPVGSGRTTASRSCRRCGVSPTAGLMGTGLVGSPDTSPVAESDYLHVDGEELGLFGAAAVLMAYLLIVGAGLRIALRTENAREAARRRLHDHHGDPAVHHRRWRDQAGPADRDHAAVRQLRRVLAGVESAVAGAADPPQRLDRPPPPRDSRHADDGGALGRPSPAERTAGRTAWGSTA